MQELCGLLSDMVTVTANSRSMKVLPVDTITECRALARPLRRGFHEVPARESCSALYYFSVSWRQKSRAMFAYGADCHGQLNPNSFTLDIILNTIELSLSSLYHMTGHCFSKFWSCKSVIWVTFQQFFKQPLIIHQIRLDGSYTIY